MFAALTFQEFGKDSPSLALLHFTVTFEAFKRDSFFLDLSSQRELRDYFFSILLMGHFVLSAISHYLPHSVVHSFSELNFRLISLRDGEAHCFSKRLQNLPSVRTFILWLANNLFLPLPSNEFSFTLVLLCVVCFNAPSSNSHQWSKYNRKFHQTI